MVQRYIQPTAQANTPFIPNNGNPNTVYNTPATPFGGQPVVAQPVGNPNPGMGWYDIAPFGGTNLASLWSFPQASTAPPVSAFADESSQFWRNMTSMTPAQFDLSNSGAMAGGGSPFIPAPSPAPGGPSVDVHPHNPGSRPEPMPPPYTGGGPSTVAPGGSSKPSLGDGGSYIPIIIGRDESGRESSVNSRPTSEITSGLNNIVRDISRGLGFNGRDGKFDVKQFLDAVTNVVLPGNFYDANVGSMNWPSVVKGVLNAAVPGLGSLATWLAGKLPDGNIVKEWLEKGQLQRLVDEAYEPESYMNADQNPFDYTVAGGGASGGGGGGSMGGGGNWGDFNAPVFDLNNPGPDRWGVIGGISAA